MLTGCWVISPLLANVYLHYAFDLWVRQWRTRFATGDMIVVRYADDFIVGFQYHTDAEQFLIALRERLGQFGLRLHPDKTRLLEFGRYAGQNRQERRQGKPETFQFLGFVHACGRTRKGWFMVHRRRAAERLRAKLQEVKAEVRGRDMMTGLPKTVILSPEEVREAIEEQVGAIVDSVVSCLGEAPPELAQDLIVQGIHLVGGGGLLRGLDRRLQEGVFEPQVLAVLARLMGVGDVVLRSDLQYERFNTPRPRATWQQLDPAPPGPPVTTRPVHVSSFATSKPTNLGNMSVPVMSGISPHRISSTDSWASGETRRRSAPSAICNPPPRPTPWTAAITGAGETSP